MLRRIISFVIPRSSLNRASLNWGSTVFCTTLYTSVPSTQKNLASFPTYVLPTLWLKQSKRSDWLLALFFFLVGPRFVFASFTTHNLLAKSSNIFISTKDHATHIINRAHRHEFNYGEKRTYFFVGHFDAEVHEFRSVGSSRWATETELCRNVVRKEKYFIIFSRWL